ncbi:hypothetical protein [Flagellimonas nanhaiensis]|uniref:Uncharacterized protein n=1 Tax=Flagellimonas nanhaiensis TaxID=2292706 RepID=A0A371JQW3_9FLAO|nr:hypothetical protein [Allomuricauda nanhaiensis]RDY59894.1 hypothetical protein DX873_11120 [Allomuricauda nanhaiensis]
MKNLLIPPLFFLFTICLHSQLDANSVFTLPTATLAQITAITDAQQGALAYATDTQNVYRFNGSNWSEIAASNTPNVYFGAFIISSTGNQTINGLPFQPSQISFVAHANVESYNLNSDNGVGNNNRFLPNSFGTANGFARDDSGSVVQQSIYIGGSGNSINDISRYASSSHCVGIRYGNQNGDSLGLTTASVTTFNSDGFTINVDNHSDDLVVLYQAYD